tara:strand:- start:7403 stop:8839 length:1437 start_codon:yes stop_codon:yes gene_type:complete
MTSNFAAYSSGVLQDSFNRVEASNTSAEATVSTGPLIVAAHGDWVTDDSDVTGGTATNWFMATHYNSGDYDMSTYSYNTTTHALSVESHFDYGGGTSISGAWSQTDGLFGGWGQRVRGGGGYPNDYPSLGTVQAINSNLAGVTDGADTHTHGSGPYGGMNRISDDMLVYVGSSGNAQGNYGVKTTDGSSATNGGQNSNSPNYGGTGNWNPTDGSFAEPHLVSIGQGFCAIGGNGGSYSNPTTNYDYFYMSFGGSIDGNTALADPVSTSLGTNTRVNLEVMNWDGSSGGQTRAYHGNVLTLPSHSGSSESPELFWTDWGNVLLHLDTANPSNSVCFPITWSGTTPTAGSSAVWPGGDQIPSNELELGQTIRGGGGTGNKYGSGQHRTKLNRYRTLRKYESGGSTYFDFVEFEFNYSGGVLYPSAYTTVKNAWSYAKTDVYLGGLIYPKNNTDVFVLFTGVSSSDNTAHEFVYFTGAFPA